MRLEPAYLVAPKPKPPSIPTRRALLIAGGAMLTGLAIGGAGGYAVSSARRVRERDEDGRNASTAEPLARAEDLALDQLRHLATDASIGELMRQSILILTLLRDTYPDDAILWHGAERIGAELCANAGIDNRRVLARWLAQIAERSDAAAAVPVRGLVAELRSIR
ncbi:MAG TPA: hypothetical protein ENI87_14610 [bacterium]|nr:hypothetical protein [bacterium]